jgi:uncharacterized surface protein with fasciclin (FAS1) repeats
LKGKPRPVVRRGERVRGDLVNGIATAGPFTTLASVLRTTGLQGLLAGEGPLTLFAPTDRAFARVPSEELEALLADPERLTRVLSHLIVQGDVKGPQEGWPVVATTVGGGELTITLDGGAFRVDGARVVKPRIRASNGVVHAIDTLLMPR